MCVFFHIVRVLDSDSNDPFFVPFLPFIFSLYCFLLFSAVFLRLRLTDFNSGSRDPLFALSRVMTGQILRPWEIMLAKSHKKWSTASAADKRNAILKRHNSNLSPEITFHNAGKYYLNSIFYLPQQHLNWLFQIFSERDMRKMHMVVF